MGAGLLFQSAPTTPVAYAAACISTADCLSKMTLDEKIGQMTQLDRRASGARCGGGRRIVERRRGGRRDDREERLAIRRVGERAECAAHAVRRCSSEYALDNARL